METKFDILVMGGGHAGVEAANISCQFGLKVGLLSLKDVPLASAPCNPSIGGVGKGQVVREVDALGGLMGKIADLSAIQYRTLNESKGHAVRSTRVQVDKEVYSKNAESHLNQVKNLTIILEKAEKVSKIGELFHVELQNGKTLTSSKLVVTTGTFLNGRLHTGEEQKDGGRFKCEPSKGLTDIFSQIQLTPARFKTGTPPRLDKDTIDFSKLEIQESDPNSRNFHELHDPFFRNMPQVPCHLARTNEKTLGIIRSNKERSPIFNGQIKGIGPRYCPSIEDKAFRYPQRNSHHVFIEPEGLGLQTIYPSGISSSLPKDVQMDFVTSIEGLENAKILVYGYAVEYDVVDTSQLNATLEYKDIPGLYFAGQVNGTSGYEEAAGQGIIAGINASCAYLGKDPVILDRNESYIGVMVEDLITNKRDEPYRLFTARSENRLFIREDNTINRMFKFRKSLNLDFEIDRFQERYIQEFEELDKFCDKTILKSGPEMKKYFEKQNFGPIEENINLSSLLRRSQLDPVATLKQELSRLSQTYLESVIVAVAISKKYEGYILRANQENERIIRFGKKTIKWERICQSPNISNECKIRIKEVRPETFGQLQRINGLRPATLAFVAGSLA